MGDKGGLLSSNGSTHQWPAIDIIDRMTSSHDRLYLYARRLEGEYQMFVVDFSKNATALKALNTTSFINPECS